jgi:hypothetical protein
MSMVNKRLPVALGCLLLGVVACESKKPGASASQPPTNTKATTTGPETPIGAIPIASAAKNAWPCGRTIEPIGARWTYDYTGAPESCSFPPDLWQPGCPSRHLQGNPSLGLEIEFKYRYDDRNRLIAIDSKLRLARIQKIVYKGDKVMSQDTLTYHAVGTSTQLWHTDGSFYGEVDHRKAGGIQRLRTGAEAPGGKDTLSDEQFAYESGRLVRINAQATGGTKETHTFQYDCKR